MKAQAQLKFVGGLEIFLRENFSLSRSMRSLGEGIKNFFFIFRPTQLYRQVAPGRFERIDPENETLLGRFHRF